VSNVNKIYYYNELSNNILIYSVCSNFTLTSLPGSPGIPLGPTGPAGPGAPPSPVSPRGPFQNINYNMLYYKENVLINTKCIPSDLIMLKC